MVAGHLQEKNDFYYIVLSYKDADGKRKTKWEATGLSVRRTRRKPRLFCWNVGGTSWFPPHLRRFA